MHNPHEGAGPASLNINIHLYPETALTVDDVVTQGSACVTIGEWPNEVKMFMSARAAEKLSEQLGKAWDILDRAGFTDPGPEIK